MGNDRVLYVEMAFYRRDTVEICEGVVWTILRSKLIFSVRYAKKKKKKALKKRLEKENL